MTEGEYQQTLKELDRLLNDPNAPLDAAKIWSLLTDTATHTANLSNHGKGANRSGPAPILSGSLLRNHARTT
jgi:hypothetical protein